MTSSITGAQTGITVNGIAPAAMADAYTLTTGTTLTVPPATGVLANDTKGTPAATITAHTDPAHGTLTLNRRWLLHLHLRRRATWAPTPSPTR